MTATDNNPESPPQWRGLNFCLLGAVIVTLSFLLFRIGTLVFNSITFPFPLDYGEGPLLDQAVRVANFENTYRADWLTSPWTVSNYPPIFPLIQAPFIRLFGANFWIPRLISLIAILGTAVVSLLLVKKDTNSFASGLVSSALFITHPVVVNWMTFGRVDSLALFFGVSATYLAFQLRASWLPVICAACCVMTKQTGFLAAPLAISVYLAQKNGLKSGLLFLTRFTLVVAAIFLILTSLTGGGFYNHTVLGNINQLDLSRISTSFEIFVFMSAPLLVMAIIPFTKFSSLRPPIAFLAFTLGGIVVALGIAKVGSSWNYFLELTLGLSLLAAISCQSISFNAEASRVRTPVLLALLLLQLLFSAKNFSTASDSLQTLLGERPALEKVRSLIAASSSPILSDWHLGMEVPLGRRLYFQPFEMKQLLEHNLWNEQPLIDEIKAHKFSLILLTSKQASQERFTHKTLDAIYEFYEEQPLGGGALLYLPRSSVASPNSD